MAPTLYYNAALRVLKYLKSSPSKVILLPSTSKKIVIQTALFLINQ